MTDKFLTKLGRIVASSIILGAGFFGINAQAAAPEYSAEKIISTAAKTDIKAKERYNYKIGFKNVGTANWNTTGANKVTIKTTENVKVEHWFASKSWLDKTTVATVHRDKIATGEIGFFNLALEAPSKIGSYNNRFALFVGDKKLAGSDFSLPLRVGGSNTPVVTTNATFKTIGSTVTTSNNSASPSLSTSPDLSTEIAIKSVEQISATANELVPIRLAYKNTGAKWSDSTIQLQLVPTSITGTLNDGTWVNDNTVANLSTTIEKDQLAFFRFQIKAPNFGGVYNPVFRLVIDNKIVQGSEFKIPVVVAGTPNSPTQTSGQVVCMAAQEPGDINSTGTCNPTHNEPRIRVGIDKLTENQLGVTADSTFAIKDVSGTVFRTVSAGQIIFLSYDPLEKMYQAVGSGPPIRTTFPIKVEAITEPSIITLTTFKNPVAYNPGWNDNIYRGAIELRWAEADEKLWIINELLMEDYLKGLAEFSNAAPTEYQKALIVAARSYAMFHMQTGVKHAKRNFHVMASVSDQYYRGYASEMRITKIVDAVNATRGQMVTYNNEVVVTPYSASSNGTSRTWKEVWGGTDKPWLVKQTIPHDATRKRFGHGVGLSQLAAADMAREGLGYVDILKFFYVGTQVSQWYK